MIAKPKTLARCAWASDDLAIRYPEEECGVPVNDDHALRIPHSGRSARYVRRPPQSHRKRRITMPANIKA